MLCVNFFIFIFFCTKLRGSHDSVLIASGRCDKILAIGLPGNKCHLPLIAASVISFDIIIQQERIRTGD